MRIDIRGRNVALSAELREHVARRLGFALGRFAGRVTRVTARLADLNGPRGGVDKFCQISVAVRPDGRVLIEEAGTDLYSAIDRASERAGRSVWRRLERWRDVDVHRDVGKTA